MCNGSQKISCSCLDPFFTSFSLTFLAAIVFERTYQTACKAIALNCTHFSRVYTQQFSILFVLSRVRSVIKALCWDPFQQPNCVGAVVHMWPLSASSTTAHQHRPNNAGAASKHPIKLSQLHTLFGCQNLKLLIFTRTER